MLPTSAEPWPAPRPLADTVEAGASWASTEDRRYPMDTRKAANTAALPGAVRWRLETVKYRATAGGSAMRNRKWMVSRGRTM